MKRKKTLDDEAFELWFEDRKKKVELSKYTEVNLIDTYKSKGKKRNRPKGRLSCLGKQVAGGFSAGKKGG